MLFHLLTKMRLYRVLILLLMKSYGGGSLFSIMRHDVLETTEQLSQERRYPVLKIDRQSQNFTLFKIQVLKISKIKNSKKLKMAKETEIRELFAEAIRLSRFSKSKAKVNFWNVFRRLEKLLASSPDILNSDQIRELNAAKKKFS